MKTLNHILFVAAVAAALMACSKADDSGSENGGGNDEGGKQIVTISASLQAPAVGSRCQLICDSNVPTNLVWNRDDALSVFDDQKGNNPFTATRGGMSSSPFKGEMAESASPTMALFPYNPEATLGEDGTITTTVDPIQLQSVANSTGQSANVSVGLVKNGSVSMKPVCGFLRFVIPTMHADSVIVSCTAGQFLTGKVQIDYNDGAPQVKKVLEGKSRVAFTAGKEHLFASVGAVCVLPGSYTGIKVTVKFKAGYGNPVEYVPELPEPLVVERGLAIHLGMLPVAEKVLDLDLSTNPLNLPTKGATNNTGTTILTDYPDPEGNVFVLGLESDDLSSYYHYPSSGKQGIIFNGTGGFLQAPTFDGMRLTAFSLNMANGEGEATRLITITRTNGGILNTTAWIITGYAMDPSITHCSTGLNYTQQSHLPDPTYRIKLGASGGNMVIRHLIIYYSHE